MPKNLDQGFATFLGWLVPMQSERAKAQSHRASVKSCLENNFGCNDFTDIGSFGNGTGVRHYSDTDYLAVCPAKNLWQSSGNTLKKVKEALQYTFYSTSGIVVKTPAVHIPFGTYASETLEVTPCCFAGLVDTPVGKKPRYEIADYNDGWMYTSPQAHKAYVKQQDERLGGKLKPLIQLVKAWKFYNNVPITSFYVELRVTKYAEGESSIVYDIDLKRIIKLLDDVQLASIRDPMGISGSVPACKTDAQKIYALSKLSTGLSRAEKR